MLRIVLPILCVSALPWFALTWWRKRQARSEAERAFIARTHTGAAVFVALAVVALAVLPPRERMFALPVFLTIGMGIRRWMRKGLGRVQAEQTPLGDRFSRAKRVN
jgi:hypothetical protein